MEQNSTLIAVFKTGVIVAFTAAVLIGLNLFYYTLLLQVSASALWAGGIICIGLYLFKGNRIHQTMIESPVFKGETIENISTQTIREEDKRTQTEPKPKKEVQKKKRNKRIIKSATMRKRGSNSTRRRKPLTTKTNGKPKKEHRKNRNRKPRKKTQHRHK